MALIYCGIDEAGYGPMLGPLCVGLTCFAVDGWEPGEPAPDLWDRLRSGVCRSLKELRTDRRSRIAIADSKKLKLSNQLKTRHPLVHLERAVLALLGSAGVEPVDDGHLFAALGVELPDEPWYGGRARALPVGSLPSEISVARNVVGSAMRSGGVEPIELACGVVGEQRFNEIVRTTGTKSEATFEVIGRHLRLIRQRCDGEDPIRIVCDRLGSRRCYAGLIERALPDVRAAVVDESHERSVYRLDGWGCDTRIVFEVEAEDGHLPVAAASIVAKLTRELAMARFNRYFSGQLPELKPTAGYYADARRWLADAEPVLSPAVRTRLIRRG